MVSDRVMMTSLLKEVSNIIPLLWYNWKSLHAHKNISDMDDCAQCMLQMISIKLSSLQKLQEGEEIHIPNYSIKLQDPTTMAIILRNILELFGIFYYIFVKPDNQIEKEILFDIWKIKGLNNRQNLENIPPQFLEKYNQEKKEVEKLKIKVKESINLLNIEEGARAQLNNAIDSNKSNVCGFVFNKNSSGEIISINPIRFGCTKNGSTSENYSYLYRQLSIFVHPSHLGVLQFGQMFNNEIQVKNFERDFIMTACFISCKFATFFCETIQDGETALDTLSDEQKNLLSSTTNLLPLEDFIPVI